MLITCETTVITLSYLPIFITKFVLYLTFGELLKFTHKFDTKLVDNGLTELATEMPAATEKT